MGLGWKGALCLSVAIGVASGCKKDEPKSATDKASEENGVTVEPAGNPTDVLALLAPALPADVDALVTVDIGAGLELLFSSAMGMKLKHEAQFKAELSGLLVKHIGLDVTVVREAAAFVTIKSQAVAVVARGDWSKANFKGSATDIEGVKVYSIEEAKIAVIGANLAMGTEPAIRSLIAVHTKGAPALAGSEALKKHLAARARAGAAPAGAVASLNLGDVLGAMPLPPPFNDLKLDMGVVSLGYKGAIAVALSGEEESRKKLRDMLDAALGKANSELKKLHETSKTSADPAEAFGGLFAYHGGMTYLDMLKISDEEGWLGASANIEVGGGIAVIAVLAAVAIPAFIKYARRAKTVEAVDHLDKLYKGASIYFTTSRVDRVGDAAPCAFPATVKDTPSTSACDSGGTYKPNPGIWDHQTWRALAFDIRDPHRFRYAFESTGTGDTAVFTARAHADLDCDGVWSTFERVGRGSQDTDGCSVTSGDMFKHQEIE